MKQATQTVESASGTFRIEDVYPLIDGGRYPVKVHVGRSVVQTGQLFDVTPQDRGYSGQITVGVKRS